MNKDSIGSRMKENYENRYRVKLTRRIPVILRLDGKAFHTLTRKLDKPFDSKFCLCMQDTTQYLLLHIQGAKCAYTQSDEISLLLTDFDKFVTDAWFDYNLQKIVSVSAGMASTYFTCSFNQLFSKKIISVFDSRAFNIPKEDVVNYFIWRQQDWVRNSIQLLAQSYYSHKELYKKNSKDLHEMIYLKGNNWNNLHDQWKNGTFLYRTKDGLIKKSVSTIFTKHKNILDKYLYEVEE